MLKAGMWIEAKHVKRKDLHNYVTPKLLKRERKVSLNKISLLKFKLQTKAVQPVTYSGIVADIRC